MILTHARPCMVLIDIASGSPSPRGATFDPDHDYSRLSAVVHSRKGLPSRLCGAIQHVRGILSTAASNGMLSLCLFGQSAREWLGGRRHGFATSCFPTRKSPAGFSRPKGDSLIQTAARWLASPCFQAYGMTMPASGPLGCRERTLEMERGWTERVSWSVTRGCAQCT